MYAKSATKNFRSLAIADATQLLEHFPGARKAKDNRILPLTELALEVRALSQFFGDVALATVARQWAVIGSISALFVILSPHLSWPLWLPAYLATGMVIATRQHAFLAIVHEGAHYRLLPNRSWSNFLSDFFCAFPVRMATDVYRRLHLLHHQHTNTAEDLDWVGMQMQEDWHWPKDHLAAVRLFAFDFLGLAAHKILLLLFIWSPWQAALRKHISLSWAEHFRLLVFITLTVTILSVTHAWGWFFLLWMIPMCTFLGAIVRMRAVAEHLVCPSENELSESRHVDATLIERLTIAPLNVNYHLAHHLFPSVPWYNLPGLHARLLQLEVFRQQAKISTSYLNLKHGVLGEILKPIGSTTS